MKAPRTSISDLLTRLTQLEERTAKAEARVAELTNANGNGHVAAAVADPSPISRRSLLTKAAAVGAAGVAGAMLLNRPKDVFASFTWTGGTLNGADFETIVLANSGFSNTAAVLAVDGNQGANGGSNIDGLRGVGTGGYSGVVGYGGNHGGNALYGVGGPAVASGNGGPGITASSGTNVPTGFSSAAWIYGHGASDGTAGGYGIVSFAGGYGTGIEAHGGRGTTATPHINGGTGILAIGGPGTQAAWFQGDYFNDNTAIPAHGVFGGGNALGVGGWFRGGRAQIQIIPNGGTGSPTGQHYHGDLYMDSHSIIWVCLADGNPGTWGPLQPGGMNNAIFTAVSTQQYTLTNSDGTTWNDIDTVNLKLTITPAFNCVAHINGSADLWTFNSGFNQDIGIYVQGGVLPTVAGQPEGWKESGGSAGTFSPNAAAVETVVAMAAGTAYTVKLVWKASHGGTSKIAIGAGPINSQYSPTRLTARLVPTNPGGTIPRTPDKPYQQATMNLAPSQHDPYGRTH